MVAPISSADTAGASPIPASTRAPRIVCGAGTTVHRRCSMRRNLLPSCRELNACYHPASPRSTPRRMQRMPSWRRCRHGQNADDQAGPASGNTAKRNALPALQPVQYGQNCHLAGRVPAGHTTGAPLLCSHRLSWTWSRRIVHGAVTGASWWTAKRSPFAMDARRSVGTARSVRPPWRGSWPAIFSLHSGTERDRSVGVLLSMPARARPRAAVTHENDVVWRVATAAHQVIDWTVSMRPVLPASLGCRWLCTETPDLKPLCVHSGSCTKRGIMIRLCHSEPHREEEPNENNTASEPSLTVGTTRRLPGHPVQFGCRESREQSHG